MHLTQFKNVSFTFTSFFYSNSENPKLNKSLYTSRCRKYHMAKGSFLSKEEAHKVMFFLIFLILAYLSYLIVKPYFVTLLTAGIIALLFYPVFNFIQKRTGKSIGALITILIIFALVIVPSGYVLQKFTREAYGVYVSTKEAVELGGGIIGPQCDEGITCSINSQINEYLRGLNQQQLFVEIGQVIKDYSIKFGGDIIKYLTGLILKLFVFIFTLYYLFTSGDQFVEYVKSVLPVNSAHKNEMIARTKETLYAIIYGNFLTGLVQTILAVILYLILGVPSPAFLGLLTFIGAVSIGSWLGWLPAALWLLFKGALISSNSLIIKGIILLLLGVFLISVIDNVVKPMIIKRWSKINIAVILVGLFGGIALYGFIGIFLGPVILALFLTIVKIYSEGSNSG